MKDDIHCRQNYNDIGEVSQLQVLSPGHILKMLLYLLHGTAGKHPGISKMMDEIRQHYYFPSIAAYVRNLVRDCEKGIQDKRINNTRITIALIHIPEWDLGPKDLMKIDITDKGSLFVSLVIHEVAEKLGINLKHATRKLGRTIGVLKQAHATNKTFLKMASGEYKKQWHKYLAIVILNYNTTYQASIDCDRIRGFRGRVSHNILNQKLELRFNPNIAPTTDFSEGSLHRIEILYDKTKKNLM